MASTETYFDTFNNIVSSVILEAGLVTGTAVQTYTQPQAELAVQRIFNMLVGKRTWEHLTSWNVYNLDGVTGTIVEILTDIKDYTDLLEIKNYGNSNSHIVKPINDEHLYVTGSVAKFWTPLLWNDPTYQTKKIKIWPITTIGQISIKSIHVPDKFTNTDIVPMPKALIETGATWYLLEGDGINPGNADKVKTVFDVLYADYVAKINVGEIGTKRGNTHGIVTLK